MAINVKFNGNSTIPVDMSTKNTTMEMTNSCEVAHRVLHSEIVAETHRAIEREDELERQIIYAQPVEITIYTLTGIFTPEEFDLLINNNLNRIVYRGNRYLLGYKDGNVRRYITDVLYHDCLQQVEVSVATRSWVYSVIPNETIQRLQRELDTHIEDTDVHIQPGERNFWNNKVTSIYEQVGETLILTKEPQ